mmetsp:Transcript_88518/g.222864  ORF Transcript_88518/g.222864 Transcript_88518/m.222864 type:complete len:218 (-) Transcript_88518:26-679(-)
MTALCSVGRFTRPSKLASIAATTRCRVSAEISPSSMTPSLTSPRLNSDSSRTPGAPACSAAKMSVKRPIELRTAPSMPWRMRRARIWEASMLATGIDTHECSCGGEASGNCPLLSSKGSLHLPSKTPFSNWACSMTASSRRLSRCWKASLARAACAALARTVGEITGLDSARSRRTPSSCVARGRMSAESPRQRSGAGAELSQCLGGSNTGSTTLKP